MEDGCSKRFDIETVDFKPQTYTLNDSVPMRTASRLGDHHSRQQSYSSSAHYSPQPGHSATQGAHDVSLTSASGGYLQRQDYLIAESHQDSLWSS